jgi:hypothetical protein
LVQIKPRRANLSGSFNFAAQLGHVTSIDMQPLQESGKRD